MYFAIFPSPVYWRSPAPALPMSHHSCFTMEVSGPFPFSFVEVFLSGLWWAALVVSTGSSTAESAASRRSCCKELTSREVLWVPPPVSAVCCFTFRFSVLTPLLVSRGWHVVPLPVWKYGTVSEGGIEQHSALHSWVFLLRGSRETSLIHHIDDAKGKGNWKW